MPTAAEGVDASVPCHHDGEAVTGCFHFGTHLPNAEQDVLHYVLYIGFISEQLQG